MRHSGSCEAPGCVCCVPSLVRRGADGGIFPEKQQCDCRASVDLCLAIKSFLHHQENSTTSLPTQREFATYFGLTAHALSSDEEAGLDQAPTSSDPSESVFARGMSATRQASASGLKALLAPRRSVRAGRACDDVTMSACM